MSQLAEEEQKEEEFEDLLNDEDSDDVDIDLGSLQIAEKDPRLNQSLRIAPPGKFNGYLLLFRARPSGASSDSFSTLLRTGTHTNVKSLKFLATHLEYASNGTYDLQSAALADTFPYPGFVDTRFVNTKKLSPKEKRDVKEWLLMLLEEVVVPNKVVVFGKDAAKIVSELFFRGVNVKLNSNARHEFSGITFAFASHPSRASSCFARYGMEYFEALNAVIDADFVKEKRK